MTRRFSFTRIVCFLLLAGCGASRQSDPVEAANKFLTLVQHGHASEAYSSAAFGFQAQQTLPNFEATIRDLGLANFSSFKWTRVIKRPDEVKLDAEITTKNGASVKLEA